MPYVIKLTSTAEQTYQTVERNARLAYQHRIKKGKSKASGPEGLCKQVYKTIQLLGENPRHPSLNTHKYDDISNPFDQAKSVFEAYVQNKTPGAYRVFWCYGPGQNEITILAITPHP